MVTGFTFCDFFVWTEKDTFLETMTEIQADILSKTRPLFCNVLLPELVGKYFTTQLTVISHKINDAYLNGVRTRTTLLCVKVKLVKLNMVPR